MTCQLYRYYNRDGALLYVGISYNAVIRASQHKKASSWYPHATNMTIENYSSRIDAANAEIAAIEKEKPIFNKVHNWNGYGRSAKSAKDLMAEMKARQAEDNRIFESEMRAMKAQESARKQQLEDMRDAVKKLDAEIVTHSHIFWQMVRISEAKQAKRTERNKNGMLKRALKLCGIALAPDRVKC